MNRSEKLHEAYEQYKQERDGRFRVFNKDGNLQEWYEYLDKADAKYKAIFNSLTDDQE